jgi:hypothetical protein
MNKLGQDRPLRDALTGADAGESRVSLEKQLLEHQQHLRELPRDADPLDRARLKLEIAQTLLGLNRAGEAWEEARQVFDVFVGHESWQEAVEACDVMYLADQPESLAALGNGVWLAVSYPIPAQLTVTLLHHIVDETPDHSDGGAVAAVAAHYIADLRTTGQEHEDLCFLTAQIIAQVAKRHRDIDDEEGINIWLEMLQLNDPGELLPRLARILGVIVEDRWWIDRDALRARLPVN